MFDITPTHSRNDSEQYPSHNIAVLKNPSLLRIIVGVYIFAGLSLVGVASYKATQYVESILELYQVFLLFSLFHLYLEYLVPNSTWEDKIAHFSDPAHGGLRLFKVRYISVVQVLPVKIVCMVVTIIATTVNCWLDESWKKVTLIVSVLSVSVQPTTRNSSS